MHDTEAVYKTMDWMQRTFKISLHCIRDSEDYTQARTLLLTQCFCGMFEKKKTCKLVSQDHLDESVNTSHTEKKP